MQNTETLLSLGFKKIPSGEYLFRGKHQKFVATVSEEHSNMAYVNLYKIHPDIDNMKWLGFGATDLSHATKLIGSKLANKPTYTQLFYIMC